MQLKINKPRTRWGKETATISRIGLKDLRLILEAAREEIERRGKSKGIKSSTSDDSSLLNLIQAMEDALSDKKDPKVRYASLKINPSTGMARKGYQTDV